MTDLRTAAQQALEALEYGQHTLKQISENQWESRGQLAIDALKAALAEPVQEPYCYVYEYDGVFGLHREFYPREYNGRKPCRTVPVYTSPPQRTWVGLTDEQYAKLAEEFGPFPINQIEAKLKEKNT